MRIAHLSDLHYTYLTWNPLRLLSKRLLGHFNWIFKRNKEFSPTQVEPLIDLFSEMGVDLILLGGDFTTTSMPEEFEKASAFVSRLRQPWIAIPGNHDNYTYKSHREKRYYRHFTNRAPTLFSLSEDGVEGHKIGPGWWVVALDTSQPTSMASSQGLFSKDLEHKLEETLQRIPKDEGVILLNHYPFFHMDAPQKMLQRGDVLERLLRDEPRIRLYLHGHTHRHTIADLQPNGLPIVLDSGSCAQGPKGAWNLIDIGDRGCTVSAYRWNRGWYKSRTEEFAWNRGLTQD